MPVLKDFGRQFDGFFCIIFAYFSIYTKVYTALYIVLYTVLYTVLYILKQGLLQGTFHQNCRQVDDQNPSKLACSRLQGLSRWSSCTPRVRYSTIYTSVGASIGIKIDKKWVELRTKIGQNWVMVSSWASLDGLAVLSVSDRVLLVYTVLYTIVYYMGHAEYSQTIEKGPGAHLGPVFANFGL